MQNGAVTTSVDVHDSLDHALTFQWGAMCPTLGANGAFSPTALGQSVTWTAPSNTTGSTQTCTLQVTVDDGHGETLSASYPQRVTSAPHSLKITSGPSANPNPVAPSGTVALGVTAADSLGHVLSYAWQATCPAALGNGTFVADASAPTASWTAPAASGESDFSCIIRVTVTDSQNKSVQNSYAQMVSAGAPSGPADDAITSESRAFGDTAVFMDADNDGMDDTWEARYGFDPTNPDDAAGDPDSDTLTNVAEYDARTDPTRADTDGDAVNDGAELGNGDDPTDASDWTPPSLRTTVGDATVYLAWNGALRVQSAALRVERKGDEGQFEAMGTLPIDPRASGYRLTQLPDGTAPRNGESYRLGLLLGRGAVTRRPPDSELVLVQTGSAAASTAHPVLFLHGFGGAGDLEGTFGNALDFATETLGWRFGGRFCFEGAGLEPKVDFDAAGRTVRASSASDTGLAGDTACAGLASVASAQPGEPAGALAGQFFTVDFGNAWGNYSGDTAGGLYHQAEEVGRVLDALAQGGVDAPVAIVGQDTGALAARHHIARTQNDAGRVAALVSSGAPHRGADIGYWCRAMNDPAASNVGGDVGRLLDGLRASGACLDGHTVGAVRDTNVSCSPDSPDPQLSAFLSGSTSLPGTVSYSSIVGFWQPSGWTASSLPQAGSRASDCLSSSWDGLTSAASADLNKTGLLTSPGRVIASERFTAEEGNDLTSIFCALNPQCLVIRTRSASDMVLVAPDGRRMSQMIAEIPGAAFIAPADETGSVATIVVPFAVGGEYQVAPAPGAATPELTIEVVQGGQTTVLTNKNAKTAGASLTVRVP
jgi:hypothetical protein